MRFDLAGTTFGDDPFGPLLVTKFDPGAADLRTNDVDRPHGDGVIPGRDYLGASTWTFEISTNGSSAADALAADAALARVWSLGRALAPGQTMPLRYELGGRWRTVHGRPRRYAGVNEGVLTRQGAGRITCDFLVTDPARYADAAQKITLTIVPPSSGGLRAPLIGPLTTTRSAAPRAGLFTVGGDAPAPVTVTFHGPIRDPWIQLSGGWLLKLSGSIAYDQAVTVDPRAGTVTRQDGAPVPGMLSPRSRMADLRLPPGPAEVTFGGVDATGTATVDLTWSDAYTSL